MNKSCSGSKKLLRCAACSWWNKNPLSCGNKHATIKKEHTDNGYL